MGGSSLETATGSGSALDDIQVWYENVVGTRFDEYGDGPSGCQSQTLVTYNPDGTQSSATNVSNLVDGTFYYYDDSYGSRSDSYGPSSVNNFGYHTYQDHNGLYIPYNGYAIFQGNPPISGYSGGLSHSFPSEQPPAMPAGMQSGGESIQSSTPALPPATSSGGLPSDAFQFTHIGGPSFDQSSAGTPTYDDAGRLVSFPDANGGVTHFSYDSAGNLASLTDPVGNTTSWLYDSTNHLTQETDALGASRYFTYDNAGNLSRFADRNGQIRQFQYDTSGNVASETWYANGDDADAQQNPENTIQYTRDDAGRITSESDNNTADTYTYNAAGQITSTTESSVGGPTVTLAYQYDAAGHRTQMAAFVDSSCDFVDDYSYDSLGRVVSVHQHGVEGGNAVADIEVDLSYNDAGQITSIDRYENGQLAVEGDYTYNSSGELTGLVYHQSTTTLNSYAWTYSGDSTVASGQWSVASDGTWTPTGGLMPVHDTTGVTDALMSGGLAGVDLLTSCTSNDGTANYSYDPNGQLIGVTYSDSNPESPIPNPESYSYDANGNRVTANGSTYVTGADNRLISDGTYTYSYDAEGNRVAKFIDVNADGVLGTGDTDITQYKWDARERLVEVRDYATYVALSGNSPTQVVDYLYDVENRWIGESIDSNGDGQIDRQIRFAYDGNEIVLQFEKDGSGAVTGDDLSHRYLWQANAVDQLMADERTHLDNGSIATDEVLWALTNQQGSVNDLAKRDAATGVTSVVDHIFRDSYGNVISESDPSQGSMIGWTGRPVDKVTGQQNNLNRWYDAKVGRWASEDPIGFNGGQTNLYAYCGNSPTNATDPTGLADINDPKALKEGQIVLFFGHYVPLPENAPKGHEDEALELQDADEIRHALNKMHERTKAVPKVAYIAGVGCYPGSLKNEVNNLFPGKWLPGANNPLGDAGLTSGKQDAPIAYSYFQKAVAQAKAWLNQGIVKQVTITIYIDSAFLKAVGAMYPKSMFLAACQRGTTVITKANMNDF